MDIEKLKENLLVITEPRRTERGNIRHKLVDILVIGLCTIICNGEDYTDMEEFGHARIDWLRKFLELPNGIPDSDTFRRLFERVNPKELSNCLYEWLGAEREKCGVVAIDGKTICGSGNKEHKAYHVVSAFVAENQITLGEITVPEKKNEITAVPELLDIIDVEGTIVTADAMSCQKEITKKITAKKADYVIGLKENQPQLYQDSKLYFDSFCRELPQYETTEKGHGRFEKRTYCLLTGDVSGFHPWEYEWKTWANLNGIGMVHTRVEEKDEIREENRYYITSLTDVEKFAYAARKHWSIENQLHWNLDVIFHEDASRVRKDNAPLNMNILRKTALALVNQAKTPKTSKKHFMFLASLTPQLLLNILFPNSN